MSETCKACDKAWTDHLGVEPNQACAELIECCAAAVHRAYCDNYKKRTGNEYFTGGNYENLDDETKEIDRATVRAVIEKLQYHETCALLQDADCVIFLHDPNFYEYGRREELSTKEIIVAKQRLGPTGSIDMGFRREFAEFVELSHVPEISSNGRAKQIAPPRYDDVPAWSEKDLPF